MAQNRQRNAAELDELVAAPEPHIDCIEPKIIEGQIGHGLSQPLSGRTAIDLLPLTLGGEPISDRLAASAKKGTFAV